MACVLVVAAVGKSLINFRGELLDQIRLSGNIVHVAVGDLKEDKDIELQLKKRGYVVHSVMMKRTSISPIDDIRLIYDLNIIIREIKPDIVFAYTIKAVIWGIIVAHKIRVKSCVALITGLGYAFSGEKNFKKIIINKIVCFLYHISLRNAGVVFFQNKDDIDEFKRLNILNDRQKIVVVDGSGVNLERFKVQIFPETPIRFIMISRLLTEKGVREYAKAAEVIRKKYPEIEFHLLGDIDENPDSVSLEEVSEWNKKKIIIWHGKVDDVRPYISFSHVSVLPSYYREGIPRTIQESMAMGRPIITTDSTGCRETVKDGMNGFLVPIKNVDALTCAMEKFIKNPIIVKKMGQVSREIAEAKYDVKRINKIMLREMNIL